MSRAAWGKAKREVLALRNEIINLAQDGFHVTEIYRQLTDRLTVGERTFRRHASEMIKAHNRVPQPPLSSNTETSTLPGGHRLQATVGQSVSDNAPTPTNSKTETPASSTPAKSSRPGQTIIPGSSLKRGGFNDPALRVATDELLDKYYGTASNSSDEKEPNE